MTLLRTLRQVLANEDINFLLTNRIPRQLCTIWMGHISQIRSPRFTRVALWLWSRFTDLELQDTAPGPYASVHEFFIRPLRPGARPLETAPGVLVSPCDGIVGAHGRIQDGQLFQAKGFPYRLDELVGDSPYATHWRNGEFVTLRIQSSMYHRLHAPCAGRVRSVRYFSGDTWNVNPIALQRVEKLFCKNERALLPVEVDGSTDVVGVVPVAAVLVASIRLHAIDTTLHLRYRGPNDLQCDTTFGAGDELGWFQHGSTVIVLAPSGYRLLERWQTGARIRMGQALMQK